MGNRGWTGEATELLRVDEGFRLSEVDPSSHPGYRGDKKSGVKDLANGIEALGELQERLFAAEALRILEVLRVEREIGVPELARRLDMGEHALLDHCELLFAEGLVRPAADGHAIALA